MTELTRRRTKRPRPTETEERPVWFIFPPTQQTTFHTSAGRAVLFRTERANKSHDHGYRQGTIRKVQSEQIHIQDSSSNETITIHVADHHGLLLPDMRATQESGTIVVTPETKDFRRLVGLITSTDRVLEIGCSSGEASMLMLPTCRSWVGFDTSEEMLGMCQAAMDRWSCSHCCPKSTTKKKEYHPVIMNALVDSTTARKEACRFGIPTVVACDIGGNRELVNVLRMISWAMDAFQPNLILIKSRELTKALLETSSCAIDPDTGLVDKGHDWFQAHRPKHAMPKHPKKAPLVMSPVDPNKPICRYHNYHKNGCHKTDCHLDHEYCHFCKEKGHVGKECPLHLHGNEH
jgi:hypothetical protein